MHGFVSLYFYDILTSQPLVCYHISGRGVSFSGTLPKQDRSRQRQKSSSGFANFFGPAKPRPSSQTRLNQIGGRNDKRSRSLPTDLTT